jgi:RNA polymerase sigma-70 factor, ECF subfamily
MTGSGDEYLDFYRATYGRLCGQLYAYLGDAAEAEDVVQEAFLRAWRNWRKISTYDEPAAWVHRVAWNLGTSRLRRVALATRHALRHHREAASQPVGPEHVVLVAALRKLPNAQRRVIVLHYLADRSVAEIATALGVPRGTVLSWLHRGRARLAAQLTDAPAAQTRSEVTKHV